ncbi:MAG: hypothetical protein IT323_10295 [Anaerolineae bacterium]|nr:hypothetical protein [Anaerolineae bacterium]
MESVISSLKRPENAAILGVLTTTAAASNPRLVAYFDSCIEWYLRSDPTRRLVLHGHPLFAERRSGLILAAVVGDQAVAIRYPAPARRRMALEAGARTAITLDGRTLSLGEQWVFSDGSLPVAMVKQDLGDQVMAGLAHPEPVISPLLRADHPDNIALLRLLDLDLGAPDAYLDSHFEDCVEWLSRARPTLETYKGHRLFIEPESGVVLAAVCGGRAVALNLGTPGNRKRAVEAGAPTALRVGGVVIDLGGGWVVGTGNLDLDTVRRMLAVAGSAYSRQALNARIREDLEHAHTRTDELRVDMSHPVNQRTLAYLLRRGVPASMAAPTGVGILGLGIPPDVAEAFWVTSFQAGVNRALRWLVYGRPALVHPATGVIFALLLKDNESMALRLPPGRHAEALRAMPRRDRSRILGGVRSLPEVGEAWIVFSMVAFRDERLEWCAAAYAFAGRS